MGDTHRVILAQDDKITSTEKVNLRKRHTWLIPGEGDSVWAIEITPIRKRRTKGA